jgi:hypothetical protein
MADTSKIWVGVFSDTEAVVFDTRCQPEYSPQQVVLWGVRSGKFDIREKSSVRTELRPVRDPVAKNDALSRYAAFIRALLEANHRAWIEALKANYVGVRVSRRSRAAGVHCYICKKELDGTIDLECAGCGWGLCECGACGCGRGKKGVGSANFRSLSNYARDEGYGRWSALPPRSTDPEELCERVGEFPVKIKYGFCGSCDSNVSNAWCVRYSSSLCELRHFAHSPDNYVLRESELDLLVMALERGQVRGTRLKRRSPRPLRSASPWRLGEDLDESADYIGDCENQTELRELPSTER